MSQKAEYHNLDRPDDGLYRELAPGLTTRIFAGEQAMLSVVTIAPNAEGKMHHHPEEQWGVLLEGSAIRFQGGEEIPVKTGRLLAHARQRAAHHARRPGGLPRARYLLAAAAGIPEAGERVRGRVRPPAALHRGCAGRGCAGQARA